MVGTASASVYVGSASALSKHGAECRRCEEADPRCRQERAIGTLPCGLGDPANFVDGCDRASRTRSGEGEHAPRAIEPSAIVNAAAYTAVDRAEASRHAPSRSIAMGRSILRPRHAEWACR